MPDAQAPAADRPADEAAPARPSSDLLPGLAVLIVCRLLGETLRLVLQLPVPGAVVGMLILAAALVARAPTAAGTGRDTSLDRTAEALIGRMGLLFVPAGAGVVAEAALLREAWLPLAAGLIGSTVLSLIVTGLVMHRTARAPHGTAATSRDGVR